MNVYYKEDKCPPRDLTKEEMIEYVQKYDEVSCNIENVFYDYRNPIIIENIYWLDLNIELFINGEKIKNKLYIGITHDEKILELYRKLIIAELKDKSIRIENLELLKLRLDKEIFVEFVANLETMLFNSTCKSKSARK